HHRSMVRRFFAFTFVPIHRYIDASFRKRLACQYMIDSHAPASMKSAASVVPPSVDAAFLSSPTQRVGQSPIDKVSERLFFGIAEEDPTAPLCRIPNVAIFRRNVEISADQHQVFRVERFVEEFAQSFVPIEFVCVLCRSHFRAVRCINIDDFDPFYVCSKNSFLCLRSVSG